jgi:polyisoprenoid-binding protein YceI
MTTTTPTRAKLSGRYASDGVHSVFGFSVLHSGISTFKGTLNDVSAGLRAGGDGLALEGSAKAESISIVEPAEFRAHVLGDEFFDAANHPEVSFRSTSIELSEDGRARVEGELTIRGTTRPLAATGTYTAPVTGADNNERVAFELTATFDRRDYGFDWQMEMPNGGDVLDWDVTLEVHLELVKQEGE